MRFEKIEMIGFKSFADRSVFSFQPGITAIIGPNGCGKSNIVDALKWVLGELSAKNMRGDSMEDVIFTGSEVRKATGMAEVTLYLKDLAGQLPQGLSEYDEISITRRLYRSGESEYLINKVPCRLKDIRDLFLDTGLEAKSYSIIEQGKVGHILNSKPIDRRFLIEETAGVMKYKARRAEASQKLELASQNLLRLKDIIGEVERQINSLHRQVKKAERYMRIREEIKDLELRIFSFDYSKLGSELSEINRKLERFTEDLNITKAKISKGETEIEERRIRILEIEKEIESLQEKLLQTEKNIGQKEKAISLLGTNISTMKEREEKNKEEIEILTLEEETLKDQLKDINDEGEDLEREINRKREELSQRQDRLSILDNDISTIEENLEDAKSSLFEKAAQISDIRNKITHIETLKEGLSKKEKTGESEIKDIETELSAKEEDLKERSETLEGLLRKREELGQERRKTDENIHENEKTLADKEEEFINKKETLTEKAARLSSLKEVEVSFESMNLIRGQEGVKALLEEKGKGLNIHGLVADIIETSPEYELAIEAVLGQKLQHIVVEDHDTILKTIDYLKAENSGRGTFIPLEPRIVKAEPIKIDTGEGIIGEVLYLIKYRDGYRKVVEFLLSDTVIVSNLSTALNLWSRNGIQKTFVTLEGDVFDPSGTVTGGSPSLNGGGILRKKRETKELEGEVEVLRKEVINLEEVTFITSNELDTLKATEREIRLRIEGLDKDIFTIEKDIAILQGDRNRLFKRMEILKIEEEEIGKETNEQERELLKFGKNLNDIQKEKESLEGTIKELNEELNEKRDGFEDLRTELMDLKLEIATLKEKGDGNIKEKERFRASLEKGGKRIQDLSKEIEEINRRVSDTEGRIKEEEDILNLILKERVDHSEQLTKMKDLQTGLYEEISNLEESLRRDREGLESIQSEEGEVEVKRAELTVKIEHIIQSLKNNYNKTTEDLISEFGESEIDRVDAEEKLTHLKERVEALGPVNLAAIEEYKELKERYDFLTAQQTDLLQSVDSLKEAIAKIDRTTEERLREAFRLLNEKFQEAFSALFEGGKATLILDGGDILNSGIEIIAQPPGKKLQNLSLLSGGEKALTAIALLFASFLVKSSPLYFLDEVDGPLDDTNIDRFTSILRGLSERAQFIVITHNKKTMESADVLYGITMEEPGISKVVSVRLNGDEEPHQLALKN